MRLQPLLLSTLLLAGSLSPSLALAAPRGFGGFRAPAARPGGVWGGGSYHFQNNDVQRGYNGYHPMYGEGARPAWNNGSLDRSDVNRSDVNRSTSNNNFDGNRNSFNNDTINRNVNVNNNFYNRN